MEEWYLNATDRTCRRRVVDAGSVHLDVKIIDASWLCRSHRRAQGRDRHEAEL